MGIRSLDLKNTNLDDANFDEDDLETNSCQTYGLA